MPPAIGSRVKSGGTDPERTLFSEDLHGIPVAVPPGGWEGPGVQRPTTERVWCRHFTLRGSFSATWIWKTWGSFVAVSARVFVSPPSIQANSTLSAVPGDRSSPSTVIALAPG